MRTQRIIFVGTINEKEKEMFTRIMKNAFPDAFFSTHELPYGELPENFEEEPENTDFYIIFGRLKKDPIINFKRVVCQSKSLKQKVHCYAFEVIGNYPPGVSVTQKAGEFAVMLNKAFGKRASCVA